MSQEQQRELLPEEGGGRLNWLLAVLVLVVAMVMGVVLAAGVQSSGVSSQPSASSGSAGGNETADKGEVADLLAHGGRTVRPPAPVPLPVAPVNTPPIVSQRTPHSPSPFEQWAEQKYMKALESPEVVAAFHSTTLEVPQARSQEPGYVVKPRPLRNSPSSRNGVRRHGRPVRRRLPPELFVWPSASHPAHQFEHGAVRVLETDYADLCAAGTNELLERRHELDPFRPKLLVGLVDVIDREGDAADADVVEGRVGLPLCGRIDELDEVEHRGVGLIAQAHEYSAKLLGLDAQRVPGARIVERKVVNLGETKVLVEANRSLHIPDTNIDMKESLQHDCSPSLPVQTEMTACAKQLTLETARTICGRGAPTLRPCARIDFVVCDRERYQLLGARRGAACAKARA